MNTLYDRQMGTEDSGQVKAVARTFTLLETIAENPHMGISDLARETGIAKATIYRFIQTLKDLEYLQSSSNEEGFTLTMKLFKLGSSALEYQDLIKLAHPFMERLSDLSHETVHMAIRDGARIIYIHKIDSKFSLQMRSGIGRSAPLHCTAIGKVVVAWEHQKKIDSMLKDYSWDPYTEKTLTSKKDFLKELEVVRKKGYSEDNEENEDKVFCIAVPLRSHTGSVVAGLSISQPRFRLDKEKQERITQALLEESEKLSRLL